MPSASPLPSPLNWKVRHLGDSAKPAYISLGRAWKITYPDATGPDYAYSAAGRLQTNYLARGNPRISATHTYNAAGDPATAAYSDSTPGVTRGYDRLGRLLTAVQGSQTNTFLYNDAGRVLSENYSGGLLANLAITNVYDAYLRRVTNGVTLSGSFLAWTTNAYDAASRLARWPGPCLSAGL